MTSNPIGHQCESWQERRSPEGARYCAGCGRVSTPAATTTTNVGEDNEL